MPHGESRPVAALAQVRAVLTMAAMYPSAITLNVLRRKVAAGEPFSALTCYDATTARWLERAGIDVLLVGDTAAEMILGQPSTIHAPLDFMVQITAAVKRGAPTRFIMADMPFMSYQASADDAMRSAGRFMTQGHADAVKLEVDGSLAELVERMARAGVPVVAHLGSRPQQVYREGGYHAAGRTAREARQITDDARRMVECGAVMILLEAVPAAVSEAVVAAVDVPVIGCGAGPACHGHVVVLHDLLGLTGWHPPFVKPLAAVGPAIEQAARQWAELLRTGRYLKDDHPYRMRQE
jgi:3-methyl-2-oxobutanoate hydroxymethyltransferase